MSSRLTAIRGAAGRFLAAVLAWLEARFVLRDVSFRAAFLPFLAISAVLFTRWPGTNFIFDEQEALLANPYVNATNKLKYLDAIHRDFWGLLPDRSIGSYRPIPDLVWRAIWQLSSKPDGVFRQPFVHQVYNVVFHALNATLLAMIVWAWTKRRAPSWLAGLTFVTAAVLTEAVTGIVGIADVLGGLGAILALGALSLPAYAMPFGVFMAVTFGLFSKESALVCVPLVPFAALVVAPLTHPERPARFVRTALALVGGVSAFVLYVELRKKWFPSPLPKELADAVVDFDKPLARFAHEFLVWFHQAPLPKDPMNNPLAAADQPHRIAGALRVYARGLGQVLFPWTLSGDYSFPQEPVPTRLVFPASVIGGLMMVAPPLTSFILWIDGLFRERFARGQNLAWQGAPRINPERDRHAEDLRIAGFASILLSLTLVLLEVGVLRRQGMPPIDLPVPIWALAIAPGTLGVGLLVEGMPRLATIDPRPLALSGELAIAVGLTWIVVSYFPHSNIPIVLPTVRAERFWYFPVIGSSIVLGVILTWLSRIGRTSARSWIAPTTIALFFVFQGVRTYMHATDYRSDVSFWEATKNAVPESAKAHLNFSVMKGARSDLTTRLSESRIAMELAPEWAMAHIYTGDTLCRMHRAPEAWQHYEVGFDKGPNDQSLIALALQCLYDENELVAHTEEIEAIAKRHKDSWLALIARDTLANYQKNKGVDPKFRPRGYNEGPKD